MLLTLGHRLKSTRIYCIIFQPHWYNNKGMTHMRTAKRLHLLPVLSHIAWAEIEKLRK